MLHIAECEKLRCNYEWLQTLNFGTVTDGGGWKETC